MTHNLQEQGISHEEIISLPHFYAIWEKNFRNVTIPAHSLFSKCDLCTKYSEERAKLSGDKLATQQLKKDYQRHVEHISEERKTYYKHRQKARSQPQKYVTIIIDGMDQSKTNVPYFSRRTKSTQNLWHLQTHITGALVHTQSPTGKKAFAFVDLYQYPHDSNLTLNVLLQLLLQSAEVLPSVLYLQLDNCFRENKNRFILAFCAALVQKKIFKKIRVNFLPVGHTHEDVDQFFSRIADGLRKTGAEDLQGLQSVIEDSYTPQPKVIWIESSFDFKAWIEPYIQEIHGHTEPHCFRFKMNEDGQVILHYRQWSGQPWIPEQGLSLLKGTPTEQPNMQNPSFEKVDMPRFQNDLKKWKQWLSTESQSNWDTFFSEQYTELQNAASTNETLVPWEVLIAAAQRRDSRPSAASEVARDDLLQALLDAERRQPEVYLGPLRRGTSRVISECDLDGLAVGQLVALQTESTTSKPLIGRCTEIYHDEVKVAWLDGSYTTSWRPSKKKDPKNPRMQVEWTDVVPKASVILYDFSLTATGHLRKATVEHLKKACS